MTLGLLLLQMELAPTQSAVAEDDGQDAQHAGWQSDGLHAFKPELRRGRANRLRWTRLRFDSLGHNGDIVDLDWTEGGRAIVSGGEGGILRRWKSSSGRGTHGMWAATDWTSHVRANADGSRFAVYCRDESAEGKGPNGRVTFHDAKTGAVQLHVTGLHLSQIAWMPDGKHVLGSSFFDRTYVWNAVEKGAKTRTIPIPVEGGSGPSCVAAAPNGAFIVVGDQSGVAASRRRAHRPAPGARVTHPRRLERCRARVHGR